MKKSTMQKKKKSKTKTTRTKTGFEKYFDEQMKNPKFKEAYDQALEEVLEPKPILNIKLSKTIDKEAIDKRMARLTLKEKEKEQRNKSGIRRSPHRAKPGYRMVDVSFDTMDGDSHLEKTLNCLITTHFIGKTDLPSDECLSEARDIIAYIKDLMLRLRLYLVDRFGRSPNRNLDQLIIDMCEEAFTYRPNTYNPVRLD